MEFLERKSFIWNVSVFLLCLICHIGAFATPSTFTYQGRIIGSDGKPLEAMNVAFEFTITNPSGGCIIYREQLNNFDMRNSKGVFDTPIGLGNKHYPLTSTFTLLDAFNNSGVLTCEGGASYSPAEDDGRRLRVQFFDGVSWRLITPDNIIRTVPYAGYAGSAKRIGNKTVDDLVLKSNLPAACGVGMVITFDGTNFTCVTDQGGSGVVSSVSGTGPITVSGATTVTIGATVGTTSGTLAAGDDSRFTDSRPPTGSAGGDLTGTYPSPTIATSAVTSAKIADGAVTGSKIPDGTITSAKILDGTIAVQDLAAGTETGQVSGSVARPGRRQN